MSPHSPVPAGTGPYSGPSASVFHDSTNELSTMRTTMQALQAELGRMKQQFGEAGAIGPMRNTRGAKTKEKKTKPWFKDPSTDVHKEVVKKLRTLSTRELRELLGVPDNRILLPHRDAHPLDDNGQATGFNVDFTCRADHSYNAPLLHRAITNVVAKAKDAPEGFTSIVNCPPIDTAAAKFTVYGSYDNLKRTYREQNSVEAAAAKKLRDRNNRHQSRMRQKRDRRLEAVPAFITLFERDPTDLIETEYMSVDESADGDEAKEQQWWNMLGYPPHLRTDDHKPFATQTVDWRAFWVTWIFYELDRMHRVMRKAKTARATYPRVAAHLGGPHMDEPPKTIPPFNMVDPSWFAFCEAVEPAKVNVEKWRAALPPDGWESYDTESGKWPPFYGSQTGGSQPSLPPSEDGGGSQPVLPPAEGSSSAEA
ncbi:hypothetical protein EXIGLDRAFT_771926 [Exidia glandulosa HHB12029]|uniref:Uncharacterized protein n=1 Tax=Exidia glandulosa HHB12029 TaxID=1314781 RepID=A0A166A7M5_EXIGL|nr:hypothetical protein EXIGLDRAFT_771926 [Exidia glandulosa HHB12029]